MTHGSSRTADYFRGKVAYELFAIFIALTSALVRGKVTAQFGMERYRLVGPGKLPDNHSPGWRPFAGQQLSSRIDLNADRCPVVYNDGQRSQDLPARYLIIDHAPHFE
jgi:hypothetical protein